MRPFSKLINIVVTGDFIITLGCAEGAEGISEADLLSSSTSPNSNHLSQIYSDIRLFGSHWSFQWGCGLLKMPSARVDTGSKSKQSLFAATAVKQQFLPIKPQKRWISSTSISLFVARWCVFPDVIYSWDTRWPIAWEIIVGRDGGKIERKGY